MASPKIQAFAVFDPITGLPLTGIAGSLTFTTYKNDLGVNLTQPVISEVGGGLYKFTPVFADLDRAIVYVLSTSGNSPGYLSQLMRPEDWAADLTQDVADVFLGKWVISNAGPDANRLVMFRQDGVTVLKKFDLKDLGGNPTVNTPFSRTPV